MISIFLKNACHTVSHGDLYFENSFPNVGIIDLKTLLFKYYNQDDSITFLNGRLGSGSKVIFHVYRYRSYTSLLLDDVDKCSKFITGWERLPDMFTLDLKGGKTTTLFHVKTFRITEIHKFLA